MNKPMTLFLLDIYLMQLCGYWFCAATGASLITTHLSSTGFFVCLILSPVLGIINFRHATRSGRGIAGDRKKTLKYSRAALLFKILMIPFYAINLAVWLLLTASYIVLPGFQLFLAAVPIGIGYTYLVLLTSSAYSLATIRAMRDDPCYSGRTWLVHILLQFVFVIDVIDFIYLSFVIESRCKKQELTK